MKVEHEYERLGAWAYLAALDVHRMKIFGRCEPKNGIELFDRLVDMVMRRSGYRDARRVSWILDNGSAHRGDPWVQRLTSEYPHLVPVHGPIHASWLNQIEIHFSIIQRKVLTPNDFSSLQEFAERLNAYAKHYQRIVQPFRWTQNLNLHSFPHRPNPAPMDIQRYRCVFVMTNGVPLTSFAFQDSLVLPSDTR